jgi:AcrR family transcriptional regulator
MTKNDTDTKQKILKTTGELFSQRGYFGVSMQDIAGELGITKAALYYHYKSKDELAEILLTNAVTELKKELKDAVAKSVLPSDVVFNIVKTFLDFKLRHPEISLLATLGSGSDEKVPILALVTDLRQELIKFVRALVGGLDITRKITYKTIFTIAASIISVTLSPFYHSQDEDTKQMAQDLSDLLIKKI